jgi:dynein heavy chain
VANEEEKKTSADAAATEKIFNEVSAIKTECEGELAKAMPIYKSALSALDTLNKNDITEMKAYANPAEEIVLVT